MKSTTGKAAEMESIINKVEDLGWTVQEYDKYYDISRYSPAGYDYSISVYSKRPEGFIQDLQLSTEEYDPSQEAYYWLDSSGHGMNGAPYDMGDVYKDMLACRDMLFDLYDNLITN